MPRLTTKLTSGLGIALVLTLLAAAPAEARRGGSFGSRGARTHYAPRTTETAPTQTAPVQRSMTAPPKQGATNPAAAPAAAGAQAQAPRRGGFLGGMGGGILGGLVAGGLLGMMLGHGWGGGMGGMLNTLLQVALIGGVIWLLFALFRRRQPAQPAFAGGASAYAGGAPSFGRDFQSQGQSQGGGYVPQTPPPSSGRPDEIGLTQTDLDAFERLLAQVQDAFAREDYAALRERTTPEIMSYLSEELSQNATHGRRNEVSGTRLLQADVAEAWREAGADYATAALRYESVDVMRDRTTGTVVDGDPNTPTQTTELWTFVREPGAPWKLSAIQEA